MYYLYIIYSASSDRFYIGHTSNIEARLKKHNSNHKGFTGKNNDWKVVYTESYSAKGDAYARERQIKNWKNRQRIVDLIKTTNK